MSVYSAPLDDMRFTLREIVGFDKIAALPGFDGTDQELTDQILEEAGKFIPTCQECLAHANSRQ